jgi:environmental stress-induced protein Ves
MIQLTPADYTRQSWKNGRGTTTELWRLERDGQLLVRLSRASVVEDGPFSVFPGIERNLTVLSGPGFRLTGMGHDLRCDPLVPVAFPGDVALIASETLGMQSDDFNVMTARSLPRPRVIVAQNDHLPKGGLIALYALGSSTVNGRPVSQDDLVLTDDAASIAGRFPVIAVRIADLAPGATPRIFGENS